MVDVRFEYPHYILIVNGIRVDKTFDSCKEAVDYYEKELMKDDQGDEN